MGDPSQGRAKPCTPQRARNDPACKMGASAYAQQFAFYGPPPAPNLRKPAPFVPGIHKIQGITSYQLDHGFDQNGDTYRRMQIANAEEKSRVKVY